MAFCTSCGSEVTADAAFCEKCGASNAGGAAVASSPQTTQPQQYAQTATVARGGSAPCPNCGTFKRVKKSVLSNIGKGVIALGLLPAVIGGYQLMTFQNKDVLSQSVYNAAGQNPSADAAVFIGIGIFIMIVGLVFAGGGQLVGASVCVQCGYKFKRGE